MGPEILASLPFLSAVSPDRIRAEGHLLQCFAVGAGEVLIREGEVELRLHVVPGSTTQLGLGVVA